MTDELWDVYATAIIECVVDGATRCLRGENADALPAAAPIFVLTAYNPQGIERASAQNEAAAARLERELTEAGLTFWPADGHSPDGSWSEPGVVIAGIGRAPACELGHRYGQLAVYELTGDEVLVVRCVDCEVVRARPRVT